MLDTLSTIDLSERTWSGVASRAALPCNEREYFAARGVAGSLSETRRQYVRIHMREHGLLVHGDECHAVYTKDASPKGVALFCPVQLFPLDHVRLLIDGQAILELDVRRCHRVGPQCYECGTTFADGVIPPAMYKRLISSRH